MMRWDARIEDTSESENDTYTLYTHNTITIVSSRIRKEIPFPYKKVHTYMLIAHRRQCCKKFE
jgi:hypothetical protein